MIVLYTFTQYIDENEDFCDESIEKKKKINNRLDMQSNSLKFKTIPLLFTFSLPFVFLYVIQKQYYFVLFVFFFFHFAYQCNKFIANENNLRIILLLLFCMPLLR